MKTRIVVLLMMAVSNLTAQVIQTISQTQTTTNGNGGSASVSLEIQDAAIIASGSATGGTTPSGSPFGQSDFGVTFNLATACSYTLNGQLSRSGGDVFAGPSTFVNLSGPSGTVFALGWGPQGFRNYATNGVLEAGTYTLTGHAQAYPPPHLGTANYSVNFAVTEVPEPAFQITSISLQDDNVRLTWATMGGNTNVMQATAEALTNFVDISEPIIIDGNVALTTNYVDVGGATNSARYYRVRMVP